MKHQQNGKPMRKRLQRQLEFYLSASNLRQDKFLQQHMDADGFLAIDLFLSFRKCVRCGCACVVIRLSRSSRCALTLSFLFRRIQQLQATQRLVLEAALKSNAIRTDEQQMRLAPKEMPSLEDDQEVTGTTMRAIRFPNWIFGYSHPTIRHCVWSAERTIYIEAFSVEHDHDSLRQLLARFGKVGSAWRSP